METANEDGLIPIKATVNSVFYRKPGPADPPFVEIGSEVDEDTVVCVLEVMKMFRSVKAGVKGRVAQILAENGERVKKGAVVMLIEPDA